MTTCGATRLLLPAFFVGVFTSSTTGNDLLAWVAAGATVGVLVLLQRVRGTTTSCAVAPSPGAVPTSEDGVR